jgi:hypothetical protein
VTSLLLALALLQGVAPAPSPAVPPEADPAPAPPTYPWAVGEKLTYSAKLGMISLGEGTLEVAGIDTVRGAESFRFRFRLQGKTFVYSLDDVLESYVGTHDLVSRTTSRRTGCTRSIPTPASSASWASPRCILPRPIRSTTPPSSTSCG